MDNKGRYGKGNKHAVCQYDGCIYRMDRGCSESRVTAKVATESTDCRYSS